MITDASGRPIAPPQAEPVAPLPHYHEPPFATFAFDWPDFGGAMYQIHGGPRDRSTVTAATLAALGIAVREEER